MGELKMFLKEEDAVGVVEIILILVVRLTYWKVADRATFFYANKKEKSVMNNRKKRYLRKGG